MNYQVKRFPCPRNFLVKCLFTTIIDSGGKISHVVPANRANKYSKQYQIMDRCCKLQQMCTEYRIYECKYAVPSHTHIIAKLNNGHMKQIIIDAFLLFNLRITANFHISPSRDFFLFIYSIIIPLPIIGIWMQILTFVFLKML